MSSNIFFFDIDEPLRPPAEVEITALTAEPYPDGSRVRLTLKITPFQQRPNLEIYARKVGGPVVAELSVIESMTPNLEFTLHLRGVAETAGDYVLRAELYYADRASPQHSREITFSIPAQD